MVSKEVAMKTISCKKKVMEHCCGVEDLDEKATQTEQSLICWKGALSPDNS